MEAIVGTMYGVLILAIMVCGLLWPLVDLWSWKKEDSKEARSMSVENSTNVGESHG